MSQFNIKVNDMIGYVSYFSLSFGKVFRVLFIIFKKIDDHVTSSTMVLCAPKSKIVVAALVK